MTNLWLSKMKRAGAMRASGLLEQMVERRFGRKPSGNITGCTYNAGNWPGLAQIHTDLGGVVWNSQRDPFVRIRSNAEISGAKASTKLWTI